MTEDEKNKIEELARKAHWFSERVRMMGMRNVNIEPKEREQLSVDYALAKAEHLEAEHELREAVEGVSVRPGRPQIDSKPRTG